LKQAELHDKTAEAAKMDARREGEKGDAIADQIDRRSLPIQEKAKAVLAAAPVVEAQAQLHLVTPEALALARDARDLANLVLTQERDIQALEASRQAMAAHYEIALGEKDQEIAILKIEAKKPRLTLPRAVGLVGLGAVLARGLTLLF
jgi:hypothetical protein